MPKQTGAGRTGTPGNKAGANKPIQIAMPKTLKKHGK